MKFSSAVTDSLFNLLKDFYQDHMEIQKGFQFNFVLILMSANFKPFYIIDTVKPVLRGHLWDKDEVAL